MRRNFILQTILYAILLAGATSCQSDQMNTEPIPTEGFLTVEVVMPNHQLPTTRTPLADLNERTINSMYILAFAAADNRYLGARKIETSNITQDSSEGRMKVKTEKYDTTYDEDIYISIVTNVEQVLIDGLPPNAPYSTIVTELKIDTSAKWDHPETVENWKGIPMWGKSTTFHSKTMPTLAVYLMRSMAKVQFYYSNADKHFVLEKIHIINAAKNIYVMPATANLNADTDNKTVKDPTTDNETDNREYPYLPADESIRFYLPEQKKGTRYSDNQTEWAKNLQFVLEGTYTNQNGSKVPSFYRFDLCTAFEYLPVLRNYAYHIRLQTPALPGASNINDARTAKPSTEVMADVICDKGDILHLVSANNVLLGVSRLEFHRDREEHEITIEDEKNNTEETPKTYLKVQSINEYGTTQAWDFKYVDENGATITKPDWITVAKEADAANQEGLKINLKKIEDNNPLIHEEVKSRTAYINVYALGGTISHTVKVIQYNQPLIKNYIHRKQKTFWLVNHLQGKGVVIRPATAWTAKLMDDNDHVVKEICTLSSNYEDNKEKQTFYIRLINGWNERNKSKQINYGAEVWVRVRFQSVYDPALYTDLTMKMFGLLKRNGYYISIAQPDAPHFSQGIHGVYQDYSWYHAMSQYDFDSGKTIGDPKPDGELTGCKALGLGPDGNEWVLPTPELLKKVLIDSETGETLEEFEDKYMNFWHTIARWGGTQYLRQVDWEAGEARGIGEQPYGPVFYQNVEIGNYYTQTVDIFLYPESSPISKIKEFFVSEHKMAYKWDTNRKESMGREYFCISKAK